MAKTKLRTREWTFDVAKDAPDNPLLEMGVTKFIVRAVSGKRRAAVEDSHTKDLLSQGMSMGEILSMRREEELRLIRENEIRKSKGLPPTTGEVDINDISDEQRARAYPPHVTIRQCIKSLVMEGNDIVTPLPDDFENNLEVEAETLMALECLRRNRFIKLTDKEKGNE